MVSIDHLTVPTALMKTLNILLILSHDRRKLIGYEVTDAPTGAWASERAIEALNFEGAPRLLLRGLDEKFGEEFDVRLEDAGIRQVSSAYRCPWQNGYVQRTVGTLRRECLDHVMIFHARHLRAVLDEHVSYCNTSRTRLAFEMDCPVPRPVEKPVLGRSSLCRLSVDCIIGTRGGLPETIQSR